MCGALAAALLAGPGCGDKDKKAEKPTEEASETADKPREADKPEELTPEQVATIVQECWSRFNAKDEAGMKDCLADDGKMVLVGSAPPMEATGPDAMLEITKMYWTAFPDVKAQPQLTLVNGNKAAVIAWGRGTNKGPLGPMPATNKEVGMLEAQYLEFDAGGKAQLYEHYADDLTMMAQLGVIPMPAPPVMTEGWDDQETVIARNDDTEQANVELVKESTEAFGAHDPDAFMDMYSDDAVFHYVGEATGPAEGKEAMVKGLKDMYARSSDVKVSVDWAWGAGPYVVAGTTMTGTMDGELPKEMAAAKGKTFEQKELEFFLIEDGTIKKHWIFANNAGMAAQLGLMPEPPAGGEAPKGEAKTPPKKG
jgi:ketosteroid isomerase-like protein